MLDQAEAATSVSRGDAGHAATATTAVPAPTSAGKTILVLEDDPQMLLLLRRFRSLHAFRVLEARCLEEARRWLADELELAFVVSDYELPDGTGLELLAGMREQQRSSVPFLLISGIYVPPAGGCHGFKFLAKPFTFEQLLAAIAQLLGEPVPTVRFSEANRSPHTGGPRNEEIP